MKLAVPKLMLAAAALFAAGVATGVTIRSEGDSAQRKELSRADLSGAPGMEVIASMSEYQPGEGIERHFHHGIEAAYVVQGAMVQAPGKEPVSLASGTSLMNLRDVRHAGIRVVGDSSLKLFTVHVVDKGKALYDYSN